MNAHEHTPARRSEDNDPVARIGAVWDRWSKLLNPLILILAGWLANEFRGAAAALESVPVLYAQQTMLIRSDSIGRIERQDMRSVLGILVRMQCLQLSAVERAKIDLNCGNVPAPSQETLRRLLREAPSEQQ